jgi:hypothetical protein
MAPVRGSSATTAPRLKLPLPDFIALYAATCAAPLRVRSTLPPRGLRPVRMSANFEVNSCDESPLRMGFSTDSTPSAP